MMIQKTIRRPRVWSSKAGQALPFSDADFFLKRHPRTGCLADSSFLIALSDEDHFFHEDAQFLIEKLAEYKIPIFVSVTTRSEFIDFHRRVIMTETLMDMLSPSSRWKISAATKQVLRSQKGWLDNQARVGQEPYLTDHRIKICKQAFLPRTQSGHIGWSELCREYLASRLFATWSQISDVLSLQYIDMRSSGTKDLLRKELKWENMYRLSEESALGSSDAMILNLFDSSIFPMVITSDYDLAYGVLLSVPDKTAFVPDGVYRNHVKKLKM